MEQVKVTLAPEEYSALVRLCEAELRSVPDQLRHMVRRALEQRRLLAHEAAPRPGQTQAEEVDHAS